MFSLSVQQSLNHVVQCTMDVHLALCDTLSLPNFIKIASHGILFFLKFELVTAGFRFLITALAIIYVNICNANDDWVRIKLTDHSSIEFPLIPEVLDGDDEVMMACRDSSGLFTAVVGVLPEFENSDTGKTELLALYRDIAERKIDFDSGSLLKMATFEYLSIPGIDFSYTIHEVEGGTLGKFVRMWYNQGRIYSLEVWFDATNSGTIGELKNRFFNSFEFTGEQSSRINTIVQMISRSFIALTAGIIGILVMSFLLIRRRKMRKTLSTT